MRRAVAIAVVVTLGATGCGGGRPHRPAAPSGAASACAGPVHRQQVAMERRSQITGARRALDPVAWVPRHAGCTPPLILFSHGHYGDPAGCARLCTALAARGFLVVAVHHPERGTPPNLQAAERDDDLVYALRHLRLRYDHRRVGVAGHSFGGRTAVEFASLEPRVRAVMTMAGGADRGTTASIHVPTLMLAGSRDTVDPPRLSEASIRALPPGTPHRLVIVPGAGHGGLIDGCAAIGRCELIARTASAFFLTYLAGRIWSR